MKEYARLLAALLLAWLGAPDLAGADAPDPAALAHLRLTFEPNRGQTDPAVRFLARGKDYTVFLTDTETVLAAGRSDRHGRDVLRLRLVGAAPYRLVPEDEQPGRTNYLKGSDPSRWLRNLPTYGQVRATAASPGIDVLFYGAGRHLEYDFILAPGADPSLIRLRYEGAESVALRADGTLSIRTRRGTLDQPPAVVYQEKEGRRLAVASRYLLWGESEVSFALGPHDETLPLVIDPRLLYATYLGGDDKRFVDVEAEIVPGELLRGAAIDSAGQVYVAGNTASVDFPAFGPDGVIQAGLGADEACFVGDDPTEPAGGVPCGDAFVAKLDSTGRALVYSTYIGGEANDIANAIAIDSSGNAYVTGATFPGFQIFPVYFRGWPTTSNRFQGKLAGGIAEVLNGSDAVIVVLNATGSDLIYGTYFAGRTRDSGTAIAVDAGRNIYVAGTTESNDFPTRNAFENRSPGGIDAWVAKFDPLARRGNDTLLYSTFLGGRGTDEARAIAADDRGNAYVAGVTKSTDLPVRAPAGQTLPPLQKSLGGGASDGFVAKLDPTNATGASSLVYLTYFGGNGTDEVNAIAVEASQRATVAGFSSSTADFPLVGAFDTSSSGGDAFVAKLNADGTALFFSSFLGGELRDAARGVALDAAGNAYVAGETLSLDFPVRNAFQRLNGGKGTQDAFVAKLSPSAAAGVAPRILWASYLGGRQNDAANAIALSSRGRVAVAGVTDSTDFPTTPSVVKPSPGPGLAADNLDGFVAQIDATFGDTVGVYRASTGEFLLRNSNDSGDPDITAALGDAASRAITGDWNGDGREDIGVFLDSAARWTLLIRNPFFVIAGVPDYLPFAELFFGTVDDIPIAGDWDGDGRDSIGVFRPSSTTFFLRNSLTSGPADFVFNFGSASDIPVAGDWDGDGDTTIGVVDPATMTFSLRNANAAGGADLQFVFGSPGDLPVTGDWDGDGADSIGTFADGSFALRNANSSGPPDLVFTLEVDLTNFDSTPLSGDWNRRP